MNKLNNIKLFIFDLDGTLLDSLDIWNEIDKNFFKKRNMTIPSDYSKDIAPLTLEETALYTIKRFNLNETKEEIIKEWSSASIKMYEEKVQFKNGAYEFLSNLKKHNIKMIVATSCNKEMFLPCLKKHDLEQFFIKFYTSQELGINKSNKLFFNKILEEQQIKSNEAYLVEDSISSLICARTLGFNTIAILDKKWLNQKEELKENSDILVNDFDELNKIFFQHVQYN